MSDVGQSALDRAFKEENLLPVYQPIHDATTRRVVSVEALLRQRRENGEIREAGVITAAAEEGPRLELFALDSLVMKMAYTDAVHWQANGAPEVALNVNLSPREFQEGNVIPRLHELIGACGIDKRTIHLEITETSYIDHPRQTMDVLEELKTMGISLWLDDFGTGYSSLEHLQHFPLDGIKIPAQFVKELGRDRRSAAITRSLIALAHELGMQVIAEGIEHQEQLEFLTNWGADFIQGFLFSKPMERDELEGFLEEQKAEGRKQN